MQSHLTHDTEWEEFLQESEYTHTTTEYPASMSHFDILADASKYAMSTYPSFIPDRVSEAAERLFLETFMDLFGTCGFRPIEEVLLDFRLASSSTVQCSEGGPTKADLIKGMIAQGDQSVLYKTIELSQRIMDGDLVPDEQFIVEHRIFHKLAGKDETRGPDKRIPGTQRAKTRAFIVPPLTTYIMANTMFGEQDDALCVKALDKAYAGSSFPLNCGIPIQHRGYDKIIRKCLSFASRDSIDGAWHDGGCKPSEFEVVKKLRFLLLKSRYRTRATKSAINVLYDILQFGLTVFPDGSVHYKPGGQPSGSFTTLSDNCLISYFRQLVAYCYAAWSTGRDLKYVTIDEINSRMFLNITGDDVHRSHNFDDEFDFYYVDAFRLMGVVLTKESSSTFCSHTFAYDQEEDVWFLRYDPGVSAASLAWRDKTGGLPPMVHRYLALCGHLAMLVADDPATVRVRALIDAYLDRLEDYPVAGAPFSKSYDFAFYGCARQRQTLDMSRDIYFKSKESDLADYNGYWVRQGRVAVRAQSATRLKSEGFKTHTIMSVPSKKQKVPKGKGERKQQSRALIPVTQAGAAIPGVNPAASRAFNVISLLASDPAKAYFRYLRGLIDPKTGTQMPDLTSVPTSWNYFSCAGPVTPNPSGTAQFRVAPRLGDMLKEDTTGALASFGIAGVSSGWRTFNQYTTYSTLVAGVRMTGVRITIRVNQSMVNAAGRIAIGQVPFLAAAMDFSAITQLPCHVVKSVSEVAGGEISLWMGLDSFVSSSGVRFEFQDFCAPASPINGSEPVLCVAIEGATVTAGAFEAFLEFGVEAITTNQILPISTINTTPQASMSTGRLASNPTAIQEITSSKKAESSFLNNPGKWLWDHKGEITGAGEHALSAARYAASVLPTMAKGAAMVAPLLL